MATTGLTALGVGSGLDIKSLVQQLVAAESQPIIRVAASEAKLQAQLSGYGQLKSALSVFENSLKNIDATDDFRLTKPTSSDTDVVTVSADATAAQGSFNIEVSRIAENHRMASGTTYADTDTTTIGSDGETLTITINGDSFTVSHGGQTLEAIRDEINAAADNTGVTALILNDDSGNHLYLAADADGSANLISVSYSGTDPFAMQTVNQDRNSSGGFTAADLDAVLLIEGLYTVTSSSNSVSDAIQGVSLELVGPGTSHVVIDPDRATVEKNVQGFVDGYNKLVQTLHALGANALSADRVALSRLENRLRTELNAALPDDSAFASIFDIGIESKYTVGSTTGENGQLTLDTTKLRAALDADTDGVAELFAGDDSGVITRLREMVTSYLQGGGVIAGKQEALDARIDALGDRRARMELRLESLQEHLLLRYNALDTLLAQLQSTQNYVTQQLQTLDTSNS